MTPQPPPPQTRRAPARGAASSGSPGPHGGPGLAADAAGAEGPPWRALPGPLWPSPQQMTLTSHPGAVCWTDVALALFPQPRARLTCICPGQASGSVVGRFWTTGTFQSHGLLADTSPPPGTGGAGRGGCLGARGDTERVCALRKRPGRDRTATSARGPTRGHGKDRRLGTALERFLAPGSHRPCCEARELGGDCAALGAFLVTPKSQGASTRNGNRVASELLEKSPSSRALR